MYEITSCLFDSFFSSSFLSSHCSSLKVILARIWTLALEIPSTFKNVERHTFTLADHLQLFFEWNKKLPVLLLFSFHFCNVTSLEFQFWYNWEWNCPGKSFYFLKYNKQQLTAAILSHNRVTSWLVGMDMDTVLHFPKDMDTYESDQIFYKLIYEGNGLFCVKSSLSMCRESLSLEFHTHNSILMKIGHGQFCI